MNKTIEQHSLMQMHKSIVSSLFGTFGSAIFAFGLSLMLLQKTGSAMSFAAMQIIMPIVALVLLPIVGPVTDKYPRKNIIVISQLVTIVALALYVLYWLTGAKHFVIATVLLIIVTKATDQFTSNAQQAAKADLVLSDDLTKLAGYTATAQNVSMIVSSVLGAILFTMLSFHVFIAFELFTEVVTLLITLTLDFKLANDCKEANLHEALENDKGSFKDGMYYISKQKYLFSFILIAIGLNFFSTALSVGMPVMLLKTLHLSNYQYGLTQSFFGGGMILGGIAIAKMKDPKHPFLLSYRLTFATATLLIVMGLCVFLPKNSWLITIYCGMLMLAFGIFIMLINTPPSVWMQKEIPSNMQGRVFNVDMSISMSIAPLGAVLFGLLFDLKLGNPSLLDFALLALAGIGSALVSLISVKIMNIDYAKAKIYTAEEITKMRK
jgi:MFS family permease